MAKTCASLAAKLFEYPNHDYLNHLAELERACASDVPSAAEELGQLRARFSTMTVEELRELYTRTFDLNPACAPYLSVHLFGEGNMKRAQLMTGLAELYAKKGLASHGELPDHLCRVLAAIDDLDPPERRDLLKYCLGTSLSKMRNELDRGDSPYALAIGALERLVATWTLKAEVPCD